MIELVSVVLFVVRRFLYLVFVVFWLPISAQLRRAVVGWLWVWG